MSKWIAVAFVLGAITAMAGQAAAGGVEMTDTRVRYEPRELASPAGARRLLRRIGDAALESCGASSFSLVEFKTITVESQCWREAVEDAVRRIDSPLLTAAALEARHPRS